MAALGNDAAVLEDADPVGALHRGKAVRHHREAVLSEEVTPGPCAEHDLTCLLQVDLDPEASRNGARGGAHPDALPALADAVAVTEGLALGGVMAVAPRDGDPSEAFGRLWEISQLLQREHRIVIAGRDGLQDSVNHVGQEMTRRNMNIQPTLTERPGLPVRIIVNRDLVLRPYQPLFFNRGASQ